MAHFIGGVCGNRGEATRLGTANSGIHCYANGWNIGIKASVYVNSNGEDEVIVTITSGSNDNTNQKTLGTFRRSYLDK